MNEEEVNGINSTNHTSNYVKSFKSYVLYWTMFIFLKYINDSIVLSLCVLMSLKVS